MIWAVSYNRWHTIASGRLAQVWLDSRTCTEDHLNYHGISHLAITSPTRGHATYMENSLMNISLFLAYAAMLTRSVFCIIEVELWGNMSWSSVDSGNLVSSFLNSYQWGKGRALLRSPPLVYHKSESGIWGARYNLGIQNGESVVLYSIISIKVRNHTLKNTCHIPLSKICIGSLVKCLWKIIWRSQMMIRRKEKMWRKRLLDRMILPDKV